MKAYENGMSSKGKVHQALHQEAVERTGLDVAVVKV